ncbi:MAG: siderophore-interacting protein [Rhodococcus sp. (in: high G+C Gram-positive bacteria)]
MAGTFDSTPLSEPGFYSAEVVSRSVVSPHLIRIVFGGPALALYVGLAAPDECVTIHFPPNIDDRLPAMTFENGVWGYHDVSTRPESRNYTVRRRDHHTVTVDFVVHETGVASTWAQSARPGHTVVFSRPRSWYACPQGTDWQLLVADLTGLPAVGRALEQLAPGQRAHVILEVPDHADRQEFRSDGVVTVDWRIGTGNGITPTVLVDAVATFERPAGTGYLWFAGEAAASRKVRSHARKTWGMSTRQCSVIGYWRERAEEWLASYRRYEAVALAGYRKALDEGRTEAQAQEEFEGLLERVGL